MKQFSENANCNDMIIVLACSCSVNVNSLPFPNCAPATLTSICRRNAFIEHQCEELESFNKYLFTEHYIVRILNLD